MGWTTTESTLLFLPTDLYLKTESLMVGVYDLRILQNRKQRLRAVYVHHFLDARQKISRVEITVDEQNKLPKT